MSRTTDIGITRKADIDLSANQFFAVIATAANGCTIAALNARALGILQNKPTINQAAQVLLTPSLTKAVAGGVFAPGDPLKVDANGRLILSPEAATDRTVAYALEAAAALGDIVEVQLVRYTS
jgi:hypothetical protein